MITAFYAVKLKLCALDANPSSPQASLNRAIVIGIRFFVKSYFLGDFVPIGHVQNYTLVLRVCQQLIWNEYFTYPTEQGLCPARP